MGEDRASCDAARIVKVLAALVFGVLGIVMNVLLERLDRVVDY
jgi:hypothetical protein